MISEAGIAGAVARRFETLPEREQRVRTLHANINPQQAKAMKVTDAERRILLNRLDELRVEIDNAPQYEGALA